MDIFAPFRKISAFFDAHLVAEKQLGKEIKYYKKVDGAIGFLIVVMILITVSGISNILDLRKDRGIEVYAVSPENKTQFVYSGKETTFSNEKLKRFSKKVILQMYDVNFRNVEEREKEFRRYFSSEVWQVLSGTTWQKFKNVLKEKRLINKVVIKSSPVFLFSSYNPFTDQEVFWYEFSVYMTQIGDIKGKERTKEYEVMLGLEETNSQENPAGILIRKFYLR